MTAVAPPLQSLPGRNWNQAPQMSTMSMSQMTSEEVSRLLMPPRTKSSGNNANGNARPTSSSSNSSNGSSSSASSVSSSGSEGTITAGGNTNWLKKKPTKNGWPAGRPPAEGSRPANGVMNGGAAPNGVSGITTPLSHSRARGSFADPDAFATIRRPRSSLPQSASASTTDKDEDKNEDAAPTATSTSTSTSTCTGAKKRVFMPKEKKPEQDQDQDQDQDLPSVPTPRSQILVQSQSQEVSSILAMPIPRKPPLIRTKKSANKLVTSGASFLLLLPLNGTFERKIIPLPFAPDVLRIGRQTNAKTLPQQQNGYFDSKVLSRQHAEIWAEKGTGRVMIRDIKSSNGTFVNGSRLSPENRESEPHEIRAEDILELGIDIVGEDNKTIVHHKVAARVEHAGFHHSTLDGQLGGDVGSGNDNGNTLGLHAPPMVQTSGRGRSNSQTSRGSANGFGPGGGAGVRPGQLIQNLPVTMETIVKKLHFELQQARQQQSDLIRTAQTFDVLLQPRPKPAEPSESEKAAKIELPPSDEPSPSKDLPTTNGSAVIQSLVDTKGTELPDIPRDSLGNPLNQIKNKEEKEETAPSPDASLLATIAEFRANLEEKDRRLKELETSLLRERTAREEAEGRVDELERVSRGAKQQPDIVKDLLKDKEELTAKLVAADAATHLALTLQGRVASLLEELTMANNTSTQLRKKTESLETEKSSLSAALSSLKSSSSSTSSSLSKSTGSGHLLGPNAAGGSMARVLEAQHLQGRKEESMAILRAKQSAPYLSIVGVVILGVGLMAVLNGIAKGERV